MASTPRPSKATERALRSALKRLLSSKPHNAEIKALLQRGADILTIKSLATETGVSRTLIGFDDCVYSDIRQEALEAFAERKQSRASPSSLSVLRGENHLLKRRLKVLEAHVAELTIENSRLRERYEPDLGSAGSNVTPFVRRDGRRTRQ